MRIHALSIDVEDWHNVTLLLHRGVIQMPTKAVVDNTEKWLTLLREKQARATWFILGEVADAYPELVRLIASAGHEVGVHGYHHHLVYTLTLPAFYDAACRAKEAVEKAAGKAALGYRAGAFSIRRIPETLGMLVKAGFVYDSSIFPFKGSRYGAADAPLVPHPIETPHGRLLEIPMSVVSLGGRRLPCCGGGYFRHFPLAYTLWALKRLESEGRTAVFYFHPYEMECGFDPDYYRAHFVGWKWRARLAVNRRLQYRNRHRMKSKLTRLLDRRRFDSMESVFLSPEQTAASGMQLPVNLSSGEPPVAA